MAWVPGEGEVNIARFIWPETLRVVGIAFAVVVGRVEFVHVGFDVFKFVLNFVHVHRRVVVACQVPVLLILERIIETLELGSFCDGLRLRVRGAVRQ